LSEAATAALLAGGADAVFTHACHDATGGNPLLLVELAKALRAEEVTPAASMRHSPPARSSTRAQLPPFRAP
jgi:hypothetical protein